MKSSAFVGVRPRTMREIFWGYTFYSAIWLMLGSVATWALVRLAYTRTSGWPSGDSASVPAGLVALELLRQRYARGEIDATTFADMRKQLEPFGPRESMREPVSNGAVPLTTAATTIR